MSSSLVGVTDLASVLLQCFVLILMGYISGRLELIPVSDTGLGTFVTYYALPALIFESIATSDLSHIDWQFVVSLLISKTILFVSVIIITAILTKPTNLGKSGLFAIFCTQSNDFALGYPLLISLYGKSNPQYPGYLYVLAPIQLVLLNPLGLMLIEADKQCRRQRLQLNNVSVILFKVLKQILKNPIIIMTILGIVWNLLCGNQMPQLLTPLLQVLSNSFSATALFLLGSQLVGKLKIFTSSSHILLISLVLVMTKILILPLLNRVVIQNVMDSQNNQTLDLTNFGFLYGTFPSAPTAFIFALQYDSGIPSTILSTGMVMSTVLSAPLMFVSANMIRMSANETLPCPEFANDLGQTMSYSGLMSAVCVLWTLIVLLCGHKWRSLTHRCTIALALSQLMVGIGGYLWQYNDSVASFDRYLLYHMQYVLSVGGILSSRIWTAMLSITLALLYWKNLCYVIKIHKKMSYFVAFIVFILLLMVIYLPNNSNKDIIDPNFEFGSTQAYIAVVLLICCLIITIVGLITQQHFKSRLTFNRSLNINSEDIESDSQEEELIHESEHLTYTPNIRRGRMRTFSNPITASHQTHDENAVIEVEDLLASAAPVSGDLCRQSNCSQTRRKSCITHVRRYRQRMEEANEMTPLIPTDDHLIECVSDFHQLSQHMFLLLTLLPSMLIGLTVSVGKLVMERPTGIFIELEFLDILLNYGQGVITFLIFGLDMTPVVYKLRKLYFGGSDANTHCVDLPPLEAIRPVTKEMCEQFNTFHKYNCIKDIVFEHKVNQISYRVFRGKDLVDWLIRSGISSKRIDAETYGKHLLTGRVIRHLNSCQHFYDKTFLYRFN